MTLWAAFPLLHLQVFFASPWGAASPQQQAQGLLHHVVSGWGGNMVHALEFVISVSPVLPKIKTKSWSDSQIFLIFEHGLSLPLSLFYKEMLESYTIAHVEMWNGKHNNLLKYSTFICGFFSLFSFHSTFDNKLVASFLSYLKRERKTNEAWLPNPSLFVFVLVSWSCVK